MSTPESRQVVFNELYETLQNKGLEPVDIARFLIQTDSDNKNLAKLEGRVQGAYRRGIAPVEVLALQLMDLALDEHYDIAAFGFSDEGRLVATPKRGTGKKQSSGNPPALAETSAELRHAILCEINEELKGKGLETRDLAHVLYLGQHNRNDLKRVYSKLRGDKGKGTSHVEVLVFQLLKLLADDRYDIADFAFDEDGRLVDAVKHVSRAGGGAVSGGLQRKDIEQLVASQAKPATPAETMVAGLLELLAKERYDVAGFTFDKQGRLVEAPKRSGKTAKGKK